ncbi:MAG: hypothetical protein M1840_003412 [Geoglossum simile]|nr:MAG: hypothetical protein M1840_003412 [Geoglossum simile]
MEPMDYEMESPVATQRGIHPPFAQRAQDHRQALGYQNRNAGQRHNFDRMNGDPSSTQHFYRASNFPGGVSMHYEAGFGQSALQSNAPMNPPNPLFFQNHPGPRFLDLEAIITTHSIFNRGLHQTESFHGPRPYRTPAATGSAVYPNPPFSTRANVPPPTEPNQMEYPQAPPPNWAMPPIGASNQYQPPAPQLESLQSYLGVPELEFSTNSSFHEHSIPSPGPGISLNTAPNPDPGTTRFRAYQHTHPSTSYASVLASLGARNDVNANISQFRDTVIPGSGSNTDSEIAAAIDVYFRTGEFQRVYEGLSSDELADPGRPLQDFEAFLERLPRSVLQRQPNRPLWTEPRHRGQERSPSEISRETNQGDQTRTRSTDPQFVSHVAHIPGAREQILRDNFTSRRPARAFERATVKAISGLQDVPIYSLSEEDRTCSICMDPFGETEPINGTSENPVRLPCGHVFGYICIKTWLREHCTCPTCRRKLESEIVHSHSPSHQFRRAAHRLGLEHTTPPEPNDSPRSTYAPDRTTRIRPSRRERDTSHNTTTNRYEGAISRSHSIGPSDVSEDISPTHHRVGFTRSRSNAFSTRTAPSAARSLYSSLNENTEIDHLGSGRQQPRRRDAAPLLRPITMPVRASVAAGAPRRQVNHGGPTGPSHGHTRIEFGGTDARQNNSSSDNFRFTPSMLANSSAYPTNDSPSC